MTYGIKIYNSNAKLIIDSTKRSMEAISWGTIDVPNRNTLRLAIPTSIVAPIVFYRPHPTMGPGLIIRGNIITDGDGLCTYISADRDYKVQYIIAGFRIGTPPEVNTGYGANVWDADSRLCFSTNLRYVRFPYRSITLQELGVDPDTWKVWTMISGGSPAYQHPGWTSADYLYWNPLPFWSRSGGSNWHLGLWFGEWAGDTRHIEVGRVDLNASHDWKWLGWYLAGNPGSVLMDPTGLLSCNFPT